MRVRIAVMFAVTGLAGLVAVGAVRGWWMPWWGSAGPLSGQAVLLSIATSVLGGVVAAAVFEALRRRTERGRWRSLEFEASSALLANLTDLASEIAIAVGRNPIGEEGIKPAELGALFAELVATRQSRNVELAQRAAETAEQTWQLVQTIPPLRDDAALVHALFGATAPTRGWVGAAREFNRLVGTHVPPEQIRDILHVINMGVRITFQMLRIGLERGDAHLDPKIKRIAQRQQEEMSAIIDAAVPGTSSQS
jgi:hypothetical protein